LVLIYYFKCYVYKTQVAFRGQLYDTGREKKKVFPPTHLKKKKPCTHILKDRCTPLLTPPPSLQPPNAIYILYMLLVDIVPSFHLSLSLSLSHWAHGRLMPQPCGNHYKITGAGDRGVYRLFRVRCCWVAGVL
jgi:hypothetical protein